MSVTPAAMRRLMREISELQNSPPEGIRIATSDDNMLDVTGIIEGPEGTPYAGGYFRVRFKFTEEFPAAPPKCWFVTKIFHPNVSSAGEICVNTLKKDWKSTYGISHILVTVKCLLIYPNPESALDEEAGKLLLENYDDYCSRAKLITSVHATPRTRPTEFDTPSSSSATPSTSKPSSKAGTPIPHSHTNTTVSVATAPSIALIAPSLSPRKSSVPLSQPLQVSPSNMALPVSTPASKDKKERLMSPSPLSTADANVGGGAGVAAAANVVPGGTRAMKRPAGASGTEKRKKALKRL